MQSQGGALYIYIFTDKPRFLSIIALFMSSETLTVNVPKSMKNFLAECLYS